MTDLDKFKSVAKSYSDKFALDSYYSALIELLEQHANNVRLVLEIGAANGIVPEKWDAVRKSDLEYYSIEPVKEMVRVAQEKATKLSLHYHPLFGNLENALAACNLSNTKIDLLVTSRSLHEIYLNYTRNLEKVFSDLSGILVSSRPDVVVYGDAERDTSLTPDETRRFIALQTARIGHGHDPATDYLDFSTVVSFMVKSGYALVDEKKIDQPLPEFKKSPWHFRIGVFRFS